jgi:hypothetical protein
MTIYELEIFESMERDIRRFKPDPFPRDCFYSSPSISMKDLIAFDNQKAAYTLKENEEWRTLPNGVHVVINVKTGEIVHGLGEEYIGLTVEEFSDAKRKETEIERLVDIAKTKDNENRKVSLGKARSRLCKDLSKDGFDLVGYTHELDVYGVRHAIGEHGDPQKETPRGPIAITNEDIKKIPYIIKHYDSVKHTGKNSSGRDVIQYIKKMKDGVVFYVEEIREGRQTLSINTLYKRKS